MYKNIVTILWTYFHYKKILLVELSFSSSHVPACRITICSSLQHLLGTSYNIKCNFLTGFSIATTGTSSFPPYNKSLRCAPPVVRFNLAMSGSWKLCYLAHLSAFLRNTCICCSVIVSSKGMILLFMFVHPL